MKTVPTIAIPAARTAPAARRISSAKSNPESHVKKVIGVVSGKGGVGKSLVTSLLAVMMRRRGYATAILDADITGPSIPKAFGVSHDRCPRRSDRHHSRPRANTGIQDDVPQPASGKRDGSGRLARSGHCRYGQAVLDGRAVGRRGLHVRRYASGNGRRSADGVPVAAGGRRHHRHLPAGARRP